MIKINEPKPEIKPLKALRMGDSFIFCDKLYIAVGFAPRDKGTLKKLANDFYADNKQLTVLEVESGCVSLLDAEKLVAPVDITINVFYQTRYQD